MTQFPILNQPTGPTTAEGFLADRQRFWTGFTRFTVRAVIAIVVLLVMMAIFLV